MTLRDLMNRHARSILGNADRGFAEPITYRFGSGDPDRTFNAIVNRHGLEQSSQLVSQGAKRRAQVEIPRHATLGVLAIAKGDSIELAIRIGEDPIECAIKRTVRSDDALFVVEVEA